MTYWHKNGSCYRRLSILAVKQLQDVGRDLQWRLFEASPAFDNYQLGEADAEWTDTEDSDSATLGSSDTWGELNQNESRETLLIESVIHVIQ